MSFLELFLPVDRLCRDELRWSLAEHSLPRDRLGRGGLAGSLLEDSLRADRCGYSGLDWGMIMLSFIGRQRQSAWAGLGV